MKGFFLKIAKRLKWTDDIKEFRKLGVTIGENCKFYTPNIDIGHAYLVEIGDNCTLTNCTILAHDASTQKIVGKTKVGKVVIGNNCFIGMNSMVFPNVTIGDNCIVAAGAIVTRDVPAGSVVAGNPAKVITTIEEFTQKHAHYIKEKPVFDHYWKEKTEEEKQKEKKLLQDTFGYDV